MTRPQAMNWWDGNTFRVPGLPVRPVYAPALSQGASSAAPNPAADLLTQLGFKLDTAGLGIGEGQGAIGSGQQPTREAKNFGDMAGAMTRGVGMMSGPFGLATGMYSEATMPKSEYTWGDAARNLVPGSGLLDIFGGGPDPIPGGGTGGVTPGDPTGGLGPDFLGLDTTSTSGGGFVEPGSFAKGGRVGPRNLAGPNPPGPDDGLAYLDIGEEVIPKRAVRKLERKHGEGLFDVLRKGKMPPGRR